jgi:aryl-alcohol dehydrogenase-like predicted oxidoreductase
LGEDGVLDIDTTISLETTWHAMEGLVSSGLVRSIGIRSNTVLQAMFPMPSSRCSRNPFYDYSLCDEFYIVILKILKDKNNKS